MKTVITYVFILNLILLLGCNGKKQAETGADDSTLMDTPTMSGWKCHGLQGKVKSVMYEDGSYWEFNIDGNVSKTNAWFYNRGGAVPRTFTYSSPTGYVLSYEGDNDYMPEGNIAFEGQTRTETTQDDCLSRNIYEFDDFGRLKGYTEVSDCDGFYEIGFEYNNSSDLHPSKCLVANGEEDLGFATKTTSVFEYLKTDDMGNWTERKVSHNIMATEQLWNEKSQQMETTTSRNMMDTIEKRKIQYY